MRMILDDKTAIGYMRVDKNGWFTATPITAELKKLFGEAETEIIYPIFPTVFTPIIEEKAYYDAILDNVKEGDKVLVVGCGAGSDVWSAWLKAKTMIYTIDINPQAILNVYATARMGGFEVRPIQGDIREMRMPKDFKDFDYIVGNTPFLNYPIPLEDNNYHDGDDSTVTKAFIKLLHSLLKKDGRAIMVGTEETEEYINLPMEKSEYASFTVYMLKGA